MFYFSPPSHVQIRENPLNTLKTVALLLVGVDHMLPIVQIRGSSFSS